jgi:molybdopterin synthase sulfur carrier subunit
LKLLYFASVRQRLGKGEETLTLPETVASVRDLAAFLAAKGPDYAMVFCDLRLLRVAVNQTHADLDAAVGDSDEVAFFPPVTGG